MQHFQMPWSQKWKMFSQSFFAISKFRFNFEDFQRKYDRVMYFWIYELPKTCLDKCLKSNVWEDSSTSNMVNVPKHCSKLNDSTFTIFTNSCEGNSGWKKPVSEDPLTSNMTKGPKHCWKLDDKTLTLFIDPFEDNKHQKSLSGLYAKS